MTQEKGCNITKDQSKIKQYLPLIVLMLAQLGTSSENGAFSIGTANLMTTLHCGVADIQMANTVYSLIAGTLMLVSGMIGIVIGWARTFKLGLIFGILGEIIMTFAPTIQVVIWGGRVFFALGVSLIIPSVLGMIPLLYKGKERAKAYGMIAGSAAFATLIPIFMGAIIDKAGFRLTFGVMAIYFVILLIASACLPPNQTEDKSTAFDMPGAIIASLGLFTLMYGLSSISKWGALYAFADAPFTIGGYSPAIPLSILGILILFFLLPFERRHEEKYGIAILPQSFVTNKEVRAGLISISLPFFYMGSIGFVSTLYYQLILGLSATHTALLGLFSGIPMVICSIWIPRKFSNIHPAHVILTGYLCLITAVTFYALGMMQDHFTYWLLSATTIGGIGVGLINSQSNNAVASAVPPRDSQQSGGIQAAARNLGLAFATALMGSILLVSIDAGLDTRISVSNIIEDSHKVQLIERLHGFESDEQFRAAVSVMDLSSEEIEESVRLNAEVRSKSVGLAMSILGAVFVGGIVSTRHIAHTEE